MANSGVIELDASVITALPNSKFKVKLDNGVIVTASISGKIRINHIRVLPGDRVKVEMSPYDLTNCRIVFRYK